MAKDFTAIVQAATAAFSADPAKASFTFACESDLVEDTECSNRVRGHVFTIDKPAELGGSDKGANPVEMVLAALAACRIITYQFHAGRLGIPLRGVSISFAGDLDLRGFLAMDESIRPGYAGITGDCTVISEADEAQLAALDAAVERHCPVADIVAIATAMAVVTRHQRPDSLAAE